MATLKDLRESIVHVFSAMVPTIQSAKERVWDPFTDGFLPIVQRAILIRQYGCFDTILHLNENSRGYAAVVLLRPAVEELIWCKYLDTINTSIANRLLLVMSQLEANDSLKAQDDYLERTATKELGLSYIWTVWVALILLCEKI